MNLQLTDKDRKEHGLHHKADITSLPAKVLMSKFTIAELKELCAKRYFGNQWDALKMLDKETYQRISHQNWDLNLSFIGGTRLCGLNIDGKCPHSFEDDIDFWVKARNIKEND